MRDRAVTGKGAPAAGQFGMSPLLDYWLPKQMPHREPEVKTEPKMFIKPSK